MIFVIIAILGAVVTASSTLSSIASLDVARFMSGEIWRIFSGHLAHLTWRQYAADVPAFVLLFIMYARKAGTAAVVSLLIFSSLMVSASVILLGAHQVYGGFSGLSCAALSAILLLSIMETRRNIFAYLIGISFCVYLLFMQGLPSAGLIAPEGHIGGAVSGIIFELMRRYLAETEYRDELCDRKLLH